MKTQSGIRKHIANRSKKMGLPPGSMVYVGKSTGAAPTQITVIEYNGDFFQERHVSGPQDILPLKPAPVVTWINVDGVQDTALLSEFGRIFNLHPLLLEDILNTDQRPKYELMDDMLYVILKMFDMDAGLSEIQTEQVSMVIGANLLLTFQEQTGNEFDPVRERLRNNSQRLRKGGTGYLAYSLIDAVVDRYFLLLEKLGGHLGDIESKLELDPVPNILPQVHHVRRELIFLRKYIWPVREVVGHLQYAENPVISPEIQAYFRDVYDHTIQVMDTLETYRDLLSGIQDLYLSVLSNRMNEIMKVLTIISTIFIPLTFLVGVYGMNFQYMPELHVAWAYPVLWMIMIAIATGMILFFKRKHWI